MKTFLINLTVAVFALSPALVSAADLPPLIPAVSHAVNKAKAIDLVRNGGPELRVPQETLIKKLGEIIARQRGQNLGGEAPLSKEEVLKVLEESEVVPCKFTKGDVSVFGFHRSDTSKDESFFRDSRLGEACLAYKGARIMSLFCMNPLMDWKVKAPPSPPAPVPAPAPAAAPPAIPPTPPVVVERTRVVCVRCCNPCCYRGSWGQRYYGQGYYVR